MVFSIFQKFGDEIQTNLISTIRIMQSNYEKEYFSTSFTSFMIQGIIHQSLCAHTP